MFHTKLNKPGIYGARALIDVHDPLVKMNQVSMAQIWVEGGPPAELNSIQFGWAVSHHFHLSNFMNNNVFLPINTPKIYLYLKIIIQFLFVVVFI